MELPGITWTTEEMDDSEILSELPADLVTVLCEKNGFILHDGALHVRGACLVPEWHSLRAAMHGPNAFHVFYDDVRPADIPFAEDQLGDQYLIRDGVILRLSAETGEVEYLVENLEGFFRRVSDNIEGFLNVGLDHKLQPRQLLHIHPPLCFQESGKDAFLRALPASEVILSHADLARQIKNIPDGGHVRIEIGD
jgi:hypothetical protein